MSCQPVPVFVDLGWYLPGRGCAAPVLTPDQVTALKARIAALELQLDQAMLGFQVRVSVDQNGERLEFTGVSIDKLRNYIETLKSQLPDYCPTGRIARPMQFLF